ncbi:transcriptional regulator, LysR family [Oxalobacteraceae bacterium IMCC9480]|nr:transcriptional regulator, LysR family [Oxalobacteraceae bacterium IMCC9480]NDP59610.1 LysR family transcriptional regulator [Oxalobacteraceae bacterium]
MDTFKCLALYVRSIELGSMSAAARERGTTQSTVSKAITALEKRLGVRLLARSTTVLVPTTQGQLFYERAKRVLEEFDEAEAEARGMTERPAGKLRLNVPSALGQFYVADLVRTFLRTYPEVEVELTLNDRMVDLLEEGVDVALRLGGKLPPDAVARYVGTSVRYLVAAPAYLQGRAIVTPEDLATQDYIRFAWLDGGDMVELSNGVQKLTVATRARFAVNNALLIRDALLAGDGVGLCPSWLASDSLASGKLVRVLPEWSGPSQQLTLLTPSRRYQPLRARLFIDFMARAMAGLPGITSQSQIAGSEG